MENKLKEEITSLKENFLCAFCKLCLRREGKKERGRKGVGVSAVLVHSVSKQRSITVIFQWAGTSGMGIWTLYDWREHHDNGKTCLNKHVEELR